jgi:uncharacterized protein GlcG (DUF336 family)
MSPSRSSTRTENLILFQKIDETQPGSIAVSQGKARTSALFKRPTKAMEEMITAGKTAFLAVDGNRSLQGGLPVIAGGR